jgi:hypothetical protein
MRCASFPNRRQWFSTTSSGAIEGAILLLIYILLGLLALAAIIIFALPFLLWRALAHDAAKDDSAAAASPPKLPSFYDHNIWRAFLSWRRERPPQLEHRSPD